MIVLLKSSVNQTNLRNINDYTKAICLFVPSLKTIFATATDAKSLYRVTFVFSEASGKNMVFIIFRRRDHYPELCSRHGASLQNRRCFFRAKEASEGARRAHNGWRRCTPAALRISLARKTRENRTFISVFFFVPLLKETYYLSTGCLAKNCSTCNDGFVRITYSLARRRLQANKNFTVCKPCNQTEKGRMKAKMQVIDRDDSKCPPGQKKDSFFC